MTCRIIALRAMEYNGLSIQTKSVIIDQRIMRRRKETG